MCSSDLAIGGRAETDRPGARRRHAHEFEPHPNSCGRSGCGPDDGPIHGNASDALKGKNKVVLSETTALKYFGTTDCVGKQLEMEAWSAPQYIVTGVVKELPDNSHFNFELLVSMETLPLNEFNMEFQTY